MTKNRNNITTTTNMNGWIWPKIKNRIDITTTTNKNGWIWPKIKNGINISTTTNMNGWIWLKIDLFHVRHCGNIKTTSLKKALPLFRLFSTKRQSRKTTYILLVLKLTFIAVIFIWPYSNQFSDILIRTSKLASFISLYPKFYYWGQFLLRIYNSTAYVWKPLLHQ